MTACPHCQQPAHSGACQPSLLSPVPAWRLELEQRLASYRERHQARYPPGPEAPTPTLAQGSAASAVQTGTPPPRLPVIVFPASKASAGGVMRSTGSAQTALREEAEPERFTPQPATTLAASEPERPSPRLESCDVPWDRIDTRRDAGSGNADGAAARTAALPLERTLRAVHRPRGEAPGPALLQIPLPLGQREAPATVSPAVASPRLRLRAGLYDLAVIAGAAALFAASAWLTMAQLDAPGTATTTLTSLRHLLPAFAAVPMVLAALYFLACFTLGEETIGMHCMGLGLAGLNESLSESLNESRGGGVSAQARHRRGWAYSVSLLGLGVGFAWIYCDSQQLAWHDYISGTCPVEIKSRHKPPAPGLQPSPSSAG